MIEYVTSRAAGWDCPISLVGDLEQLKAHPRTPDNLEVIRRWEDVRAREWLSGRQKTALQKVAGQDGPARAFVFARKAKIYLVFWHMSGEGSMEIPMQAGGLQLMAELGKPRSMPKISGGIRVPLAGRLYLECESVSHEAVVRAFRNARILG